MIHSEAWDGRLFIGGGWTEAHATGRLRVANPCDGSELARVVAADAQDCDVAVAAARRAFDDGWSASAGAERAPLLRAIAAGIRGQREALAGLEARNNGKPLPEALWDIDDAAACFDYYAGLARQLDGRQGEAIALPSRDFGCAVYLEPVGVVAAIVPWNFPLLMAAWKVAPALAAGCTVVLKPSELTPLTAMALGDIARHAGLPDGVLNIVTGDGTAGAALAAHPGIDKIAFTGSQATGARVMQAAADDIKNITLELGGKSPIVVFDDADLEAAVEWVMFGIVWNKGEVCSATSRLLVQQGIAARLLARLRQACEELAIGDPLQPGTQLGPLVSEVQHRKVLGYLSIAREEGLAVLTGGDAGGVPARGFFLRPAVYVDVPTSSRLWTEEVFGPVLCVRRFATEEEALRLANDSAYGLGAAVLTADDARAARVSRAFRAGVVWVNCSQPTFVQAPWGGFKRSGIGRELGRWGLDLYLEVKQVTTYRSPAPWGWFLKKKGSE